MNLRCFGHPVLLSIIGWGATDEKEEQSQYLRQIDLLLNKVYDRNNSARYILETKVGELGMDTCEGDSGSPIYSSIK